MKQEQTLSSCFFISSACLSQVSFRLSVSRRVSASTAPSLRSASAFSCAAHSVHSANCALRNTFSLWSSCNPCDDKGLIVSQEGHEKTLFLFVEAFLLFLPTCRRSTHMSPYEAPRPRRAPWTCRSLSLRRCSNWAICCFCLVDNQIHYQQKRMVPKWSKQWAKSSDTMFWTEWSIFSKTKYFNLYFMTLIVWTFTSQWWVPSPSADFHWLLPVHPTCLTQNELVSSTEMGTDSLTAIKIQYGINTAFNQAFKNKTHMQSNSPYFLSLLFCTALKKKNLECRTLECSVQTWLLCNNFEVLQTTSQCSSNRV